MCLKNNFIEVGLLVIQCIMDALLNTGSCKLLKAVKLVRDGACLHTTIL